MPQWLGFGGARISLLLLFLGAMAGCPQGDDDDDVVDDDDDVTDDDDDSAPSSVVCDGSLPVVTEAEENGTVPLANDLGDLPDEGFCVQGEISCGDYSYVDLDLFRMVLPLERDVRFVLSWGGDGDFDRYVWDEAAYDPDSDDWELGFEDGAASPEDRSVVLDAETSYLIEVGCWSGSGGSYSLEVTYVDLLPGDDDDSAGDDDDDDDDDDSTGDDDDSAEGSPTWSDVYFNVVSAQCSCHSTGNTGGWTYNNSSQAGYAAFVGVPSDESPLQRVEAGESSQSYLMHKLDGTQLSVGGSGQQMPRNAPQLPQSLRDMVREWIDAGALND